MVVLCCIINCALHPAGPKLYKFIGQLTDARNVVTKSEIFQQPQDMQEKLYVVVNVKGTNELSLKL